MKKEQEFEGMASSLDQQARDLFVPPSLQEDLKEGESRGNSDSVQQTQHYPRPDAVPEGILISAEQLRGLVVHAPAAAEPGMSEFKASPSVRDVVLDVVPAADSRPELDPNSSVTEFFAIDGLNQGSAGDLDDQTGGPGLQQVLNCSSFFKFCRQLHFPKKKIGLF